MKDLHIKSAVKILVLSKKILSVFHNFENYDLYLIFQEIRKFNFEINVIPKTTETFLRTTTLSNYTIKS